MADDMLLTAPTLAEGPSRMLWRRCARRPCKNIVSSIPDRLFMRSLRYRSLFRLQNYSHTYRYSIPASLDMLLRVAIVICKLPPKLPFTIGRAAASSKLFNEVPAARRRQGVMAGSLDLCIVCIQIWYAPVFHIYAAHTITSH